MIKRHEVQVLLRSGLSHRQVAKRTGVSKRTVTRIAQENSIETLEDLALSRAVGRPGVAAPYENVVREILAEQRDVPAVEILHRLRGRGYTTGKSAVYQLVHSLRGPAPHRVMVRFEGVAGEEAQVDFGLGALTESKRATARENGDGKACVDLSLVVRQVAGSVSAAQGGCDQGKACSPRPELR